MIWKLRRKFILISTLSMLGVFALIFLLISVFSYSTLDSTMDTLTDMVASGKWKFPEPEHDDDVPPPKGDDPGKPGIIGSETRFSTRYFTVTYEDDGDIEVDTEHIHAVNETEAIAYAAAVKDGAARGWYEEYQERGENYEEEVEVVYRVKINWIHLS